MLLFTFYALSFLFLLEFSKTIHLLLSIGSWHLLLMIRGLARSENYITLESISSVKIDQVLTNFRALISAMVPEDMVIRRCDRVKLRSLWQ